jgi:serine protease Do
MATPAWPRLDVKKHAHGKRGHGTGVWRWSAVVALLAMTTVAVAGDDLSSREQEAFQAAVQRVAPSVVRIETVGGRERLDKLLLGTGPTTGLVVGSDGLIVSSAFHFRRRPDSILVQLPDGSRKPARLLATDHSRMIVLLKIDVDAPLAVPEMTPRDAIRVGQWAIAVGRTFEGNRPNMSVGIISATSRIRGRAIQTDAATSPNNYGGPLLDIQGRVIGVLTPLSPKPDEKVGRIQWYDSGIGFAAAADDILHALPRLGRGEDLYPGLMGIAFSRSDPNTAAPIIAACRPGSPAYKKLKPGDRITAVNALPVDRVTELEDVVGRLYAGDEVTLSIQRGAKQIKQRLTLVAELPPYARPFLGILPRRDAATPSGAVAVRYVYPESGVAGAGIKAGDVLLSLAGKTLSGADDLRQRIALLEPGDEATLDVRRNGAPRSVSARLGRLPETLPVEELPPARIAEASEKDGQAPHGKVAISVPEIENKAWAYVPDNYRASIPCGVVVWLDAPGAVDDADILRLWKPSCDQRDLILLVVKPANPAVWLPDEEAVVARLLDEVINRYSVDANRIVAHGYQGGGTLAYLVARGHRDLIRAVATVDATLPGDVPPAEPVQPLAFYLVTAEKSPHAARMTRSIRALRKANHPVQEQSTGELPRYLLQDEAARLAKWIDTLDRI